MTEAAIDEDVLRDLLREQHPDLAELPLRRAATGWDNELWRLGDALALRLPHATERAGELLRKEYRWLPALAPALPLPVPTPVRLGEPSARFPKPWTVAAWVPGEPADRTPVSRGDHAARVLAEFLGALHRPAPAGAPASPDRGVALSTLADGFEQGWTALADDLGPDLGVAPGAGARLRAIWSDALAAPAWQAAPVWLHGDLHPANVVVRDGTLAGVIDFGELCAGDPAVDLAAAWLLLPAGAAAPFFDAYAAADDATVRRARGWAVRSALGLLAVGTAGERGLPGGKPTWLPAGRATLTRLLSAAASPPGA